ncbi:MAG: hypothetical protein IJ432_04285 [Clostridia bacterium]|nr:hypothetical protein [Clostridia bacterium]
MKKYDGVLKRVRALEQKKGIVYAKPDGKLCRSLRVIYTVVFAYTMAINLLYIAGMLITVDAGTTLMPDVLNSVLTVSACSIFVIAGLVLMYCKFYLTAGITSVIPLVFLVPVFAVRLKDDLDGLFGYKYSFYWRHFVPIVIMILLMVWMTVIAQRAKIKTDRLYKKVTENLFNMYKVTDDESENISEEQWNDFLQNYNPDEYKGQIVREITEEKAENNEVQ